MQEHKKVEPAKVCLEIKHLQAYYLSPVNIKSYNYPFLSLVPHRWTLLPIPRWQGRTERASGVPEATHQPTLSGCVPKQGKEADAKAKRRAWNWARCQRGPWQQAVGTHSGPQEGCSCGENPGSAAGKALLSPKSSLESHTCSSPPASHLNSSESLQTLTAHIKGAHFHSFDVSPPPPLQSF